MAISAEDQIIHHLKDKVGLDRADELVAELKEETKSYRKAILKDRADENRELRRDAARAVELIERGDIEQAKSLLRSVSRHVAEQ
ncbi:hypothetical protein ACWGUL_01340 [Streptomyces albidoflavus]